MSIVNQLRFGLLAGICALIILIGLAMRGLLDRVELYLGLVSGIGYYVAVSGGMYLASRPPPR